MNYGGGTHILDKNPLLKLIWVFAIGALMGCIYETLLTLVSTGQFERRVSLVIGPFNVIYGIGAVTLYLVFLMFKNKPNPLTVFVVGAIVATAVEYLLSWFQEIVFHTRSWDYSHLPLSIEGRVCLYAFLAWGVLSVLWVWVVEPLVSGALRLIPDQFALALTIALFAFLLVDAMLTVGAMLRWIERVKDVAKPSLIGDWFDQYFPNDRLKLLFGNMQFL
ncbi:hypothetical protein FACS18948_4370 [Clostridia bacterium]|nr:hypothetical protein FACS18948_4370 [Clostridia bacterium]